MNESYTKSKSSNTPVINTSFTKTKTPQQTIPGAAKSSAHKSSPAIVTRITPVPGSNKSTPSNNQSASRAKSAERKDAQNSGSRRGPAIAKAVTRVKSAGKAKMNASPYVRTPGKPAIVNPAVSNRSTPGGQSWSISIDKTSTKNETPRDTLPKRKSVMAGECWDIPNEAKGSKPRLSSASKLSSAKLSRSASRQIPGNSDRSSKRNTPVTAKSPSISADNKVLTLR